ncbi:MAG: hypothetical protein GY854_20145 [Deltaproteobacteria bacterium]|nr:hypothetical protein [Deltaproteobacteria bacterium]
MSRQLLLYRVCKFHLWGTVTDTVAIALFSVMLLSWPVAAYFAAAKIRRFSRKVTIRYVITACVLTLWFGVLFTDAAAMKVRQAPWIEWALPLGWILGGVLFVVFHKFCSCYRPN